MLMLAYIAFLWISLVGMMGVFLATARDTERRAGCLTLLMFTLVLTISLDRPYVLIDTVIGTPNSARLLADCLSIVGIWSLQPAMGFLKDATSAPTSLPGGSRYAFGTLAAQVFFFALARGTESAPRDFIQRYGASPFVLAGSLVHEVFIAAVFLRLCHHGVRESWLRRGRSIRSLARLRTGILTIGFGFGVTEPTYNGLHALTHQQGLWFPAADPYLIGNYLRGAIAVAFTCGILLEACYRPLASPRRGDPYWAEAYTTYRRLYPLWRDLTQLTPQIAHPSFRSRSLLTDLLAINDIGLRVRRRETEIRDGLHEVRRWADQAVTDRVQALCREIGIDREAARAVVEAETIRAAIECKKRGEMAMARPSEVIAGFRGERDHLVRVADMYRHSPLQTDRRGW